MTSQGIGPKIPDHLFRGQFVSRSGGMETRLGRASVIVGMEFTIDNCVQGHHISKEFWTLEVKEEFDCQGEEGNPNDVYRSL